MQTLAINELNKMMNGRNDGSLEYDRNLQTVNHVAGPVFPQ